LDVGAAENIEAALDLDYPGDVETLFVFDDRNEPVIPLVESAIRDARGESRRSAKILIAGQPRPGRTGKLNAMILGVRAAAGELIAVCDSDTRPPRDALRVLAETLLEAPEVGAAFAPVVVLGPAETAGDVGYGLMLNALYGPAAATAFAHDGELPFIMGQYMIIRREALDAIGGFESVEGQLVDDMYIGALLNKVGFHNLVASTHVPVIQVGMGLADFFRTYRRWIIFSRSGLPNWSFKWPNWLRGIEFWVAFTALIWALSLGNLFGALFPLAAVVASCWSLAELNRLFGGGRVAAKHLWMTFALLSAAPFVYLASFIHPTVRWRGREYQLDGHGRLAMDPQCRTKAAQLG